MFRSLMLIAVGLAVAGPAQADQASGAAGPPPSTIEKFLRSEVVVVGKVVRIEKDTVEATAPYIGAKEKKTYRVAVVKIDSSIVGAKNAKEIRIGFVPWPKRGPNDRPLRTDILIPELKEGQESIFFVSKHPTAGFHVMMRRDSPMEISTEQGKAELAILKRAAERLADPMKGLKSDRAEVRAETAALLLIKYRTSRGFVAQTEAVPIDAEESRLILKGLAEGEWAYRGDRPYRTYAPLAHLAFWQLRLTEKDGWVPPVIVPPQPGTPPPDEGLFWQDAFAKWIKGPGKDYRIKKIVPRKTNK